MGAGIRMFWLEKKLAVGTAINWGGRGGEGVGEGTTIRHLRVSN